MNRSAQRQPPEQPLSFSDQRRQRYADVIGVEEAGEFMIGDYLADGGFGSDGEFRVTLVELFHRRQCVLLPHLRVFWDGTDSLRRAVEAGLLDALRPVASRDAFARRLLLLGMVDRSDVPLPDLTCGVQRDIPRQAREVG
ncbi:MAG: hypothetical protein H0X42_06430 [Solirubrobacterales bacterium]|nr:hypothetical protein [Solirubrobacterales bacterium]